MNIKKLIIWAGVLALIAAALAVVPMLLGRSRAICCRIRALNQPYTDE